MMKLSDAVQLEVSEARYLCEVFVLEDEEGPRWKFGYNGKRVTDPAPDILLLGAYRHPSTGNNLVGGVNLNYITPEQRDQIARALPEIMRPNNLKGRYHAGKRLVPDVFSNYYRTYNSDFIRGVQKDVMYPKYGYMKTAQKWLKKKLGRVFKSKAKLEKEAEPKYPDDLRSMQDRLDQAVIQLATAPPPQEPPDSPEMQSARRAFQDFQRRKTMQDIERIEDEPMMVAQQDLEQAYAQPGEQPAETNEVQTTSQQQGLLAQSQPDTPEQIAQELEKERLERETELNDPNNEWDPNSDLVESIIFFSPITGHYMIENVPELA